jgi:membrane-associated phospholipid phosphatase
MKVSKNKKMTKNNLPSLLISFLIVCGLSVGGYSQNFENNILKTLNTNRNITSDPIFIHITDSVYPMSMLAPIGTLGVGLLKKDKTLTNKGLTMAASITVAMGASTVLKYTIKRQRPYEVLSFINPAEREATPSFPSGHTTAAFNTATNLTLAFPKWYVAVPAYAWAGTVGYTRMRLGVHYPSDVLAGAILGVGSAIVTKKANQWLQKKRHK